MKKNRTLLVLTAALVVILAGAAVLYPTLSARMGGNQLAITGSDPVDPSEAPQETEAVKTAAPDFTLLDIDGNEVSFSDFAGKPAIINFWSSDCPPCKEEMPHFEAAYQTYGDQIQFMMIDGIGGRSDTMAIGKKYIKSEGYTFPTFYDTEQNAQIAYGVQAFPTTYFVDADGYLVAWAQGMLDEASLQKGIDMILGTTEE